MTRLALGLGVSSVLRGLINRGGANPNPPNEQLNFAHDENSAYLILIGL